jgi:hypothetical protein
MQQSRDQLENAGANLIGVVYNNFDPGQGGAYPYAYTYYYQYYGTEDAQDPAAKKRRFRKMKKVAPAAASTIDTTWPALTSAGTWPNVD